MVVDFSGNIVSQPFLVSTNISVSPSDDLRYLNDGTVVWAYVDIYNEIKIFSLPTPPQMNLNYSTVPTRTYVNYGNVDKICSSTSIRNILLSVLSILIMII